MIEQYYNAILDKLEEQIRTATKHCDPLQTSMAIAHMKIEAFECAAKVAGYVAAYASAIDEQQNRTD